MSNNYLSTNTPDKVISKSVLITIAVLMMVPIIIIVSSWLQPTADIWQHMNDYVLPHVYKNTSLLVAMVILGTGIIGTALAWFTSVYDFYGQRYFTWMLMLPLAMPAYVLAFITVGIVDYSGILQSSMRDIGISQTLPQIRNIWGCGIVLSLAFYPYVYLLARQAFVSQGKQLLEAGQMLGLNRRQVFFKLALPQALPWIMGGILLACMETLADFGAVSVFNVDTFTTAIYKAWFGFFSLTTASQLSAILITVMFSVTLFEQFLQKKRQTPTAHRTPALIKVSASKSIAMMLCCFLVFLIAFIIPITQLIYWTLQSYEQDLNHKYVSYIINTMSIAGMTSIILASLALVVSWIKRKYNDTSTNILIALSNVGYAVPGTVLAVAIVVCISLLDNALIAFGISDKQVLAGSILVMILALLVRFMAVSFQPIDRQQNKLSHEQIAVAKQLTKSSVFQWYKLILPVLRPGILAALLLVFVEVMKEMPITLMTRRHGWDTLAVRVFEMTSEGMWERAALPSLLIVLVGLIPVWLAVKSSDSKDT